MDSPHSDGARASGLRWLLKRRSFSRYRNYVRGKLGLQLMSPRWALNNLVDIARVFDSRGSQYALTAGTLLGAIREGDFIGHDNDVDLMVPVSTFDPRIMYDLMAEGFEISRCLGFPDDGLEISLRRHGVQTDLFFLYPRRSKIYLSGYFWEPYYDDGSATWIDYEFPDFDYGWLEFKGHRFRAPSDPEMFLVPYYGNSWRTPVRDWQYHRDPPNAEPRTERINFEDSYRAIARFLQRESGIVLRPKLLAPLPNVRTRRNRKSELAAP